MRVRISLRWIFIAAVSYVLSSPFVQAQNRTVIDTYTDATKASSTIGPLDNELLGDRTSLIDGSTEFYATDVSAPTNSTLRVSLGRKLSVSQIANAPDPGVFGRFWDLDVPFIRGTFHQVIGWKANNGIENGGSNQRCSSGIGNINGMQPPAVSGQGVFNQLHYVAVDYWSGNKINIPGVGEEDVLYPGPPNAQAMPGDGAAYSGSTRSSWRISCLSTIKNGAGDGFRVTLPDGSKYYFDWMAARTAAPIFGKTSNGVGISIPRSEITLYATRVEDRFGNWLTYTYDGAQPSHLLSISSSDGVTVGVTYNSTGRVASVTSGTKTWAYEYDSQPAIKSVTLQDGSRWTYAYQGIYNASLTDAYSLWASCTPNVGSMTSGQNPPAGHTSTITIGSPSGATGVFKFRRLVHGTKGTPSGCYQFTYLGNSFPVINGPAMAYQIPSIYAKSIFGPGIASRTWNYFYEPSWSWGASCSGCTSTTTVIGPSGVELRYVFGNDFSTNFGQLLQSSVLQNGVEERKTTSAFMTDSLGQVFPASAGIMPFRGNQFAFENHPEVVRSTVQDAVTFTSTVNSFDEFVFPLSVTRGSAGGSGGNFSRIEKTTYTNDVSKWVIGQVSTVTDGSTGLMISKVDYDPVLDLPVRIYKFGVLQQTIAYNSDGTVSTVKDGRNNTIALGNWYRGIPQSIALPTGASKSAIVSSGGNVSSSTNEVGDTTFYSYDAADRLAGVTYPSGDSTAWNPLVRTFSPVATSEFGLPAGHWKSVETVGSGRVTTLFNASRQPVLTIREDLDDPGTRSFVVRRYDAFGREVFASYPIGSLVSVNDALGGVSKTYDSLGRLLQIDQDSELGVLTSKYDHLDGFRTRVTNARGGVTTIDYQVYDEPNTQLPLLVQSPEGVTTEIVRQPTLGKPVSVTRRGSFGGQALSASRTYVYDEAQRLCETVEPESGSTIVAYDDGGNIAWSADGQTSGITAPGTRTQAEICADDRNAVDIAKRISRTYDSMNRELSRSSVSGKENVTTSYAPDGLIETLLAANPGGDTVRTSYAYNKRRLLVNEVLQVNTLLPWTFAYTYDGNGHLSSQTYPGSVVVGYAPDGLGRPTQAGTFASNVTYYPNGAISGFTYGNGIVHSMTQNARQLPARSLDSYVSDGITTRVLDDTFTYDANGNLLSLVDASGAPTADNRTWGVDPLLPTLYDGLDRLKQVKSANQWGLASYSYDPLDNLRTNQLGATTLTYSYDIANRLSSLTNGLGSHWAITTDTGGNITANALKNQSYQFDLAHRMNAVTGKESYLYDGHGRRARTLNLQTGTIEYFGYGKDGRLLQDWSNRRQVRNGYIYLGNTLVGLYEVNLTDGTITPKYQHTDALGSPVVTTKKGLQLNDPPVVLSRMSYTPYGQPTLPMDGVGYTGHFIDVGTQLTYMQQRYYDASFGRFLSPDPVPASTSNGSNFNRFKYSANNPLNFVDPDGQFELPNPKFFVGTFQGAVDTLMYGATVACGEPVILFGIPSDPVQAGGYKFGSAGAIAVTVTQPARAAGSAVGTAPLTKPVGRYMSPRELEAMRRTGRVQEGGGGQTRVADPASSDTYRAAPKADIYVEFEVPASRVLPHSEGTGRIPGPNSPDARVPGKNPADYEMPKATQIKVQP